MKNVIIAGISRAGKSTSTKKIVRDYNLTYIPFDALVSTLEALYPQSGICHMDENIKMSKKIAEFVCEFIIHLDYEDIGYMLASYQILPSDIKKIHNHYA